MAIICANGHENDEGNRFCDQCGLPLTGAGAPAAPTTAAPVAAGSATGAHCPVCGQENVPGTAFCDNCGAALPPPQPVAMAGTEAGAPGERAGEAISSFPAAEDQEAVAAPPAAPMSASGAIEDATPLPTEGVVPPVAEATAPAPAEETVPPAETSGAPAATEQPEAPARPVPVATADRQAERERLEREIETQRQLVSQLEQLEQQFGAAMPPALRQGLDEARQQLQRAEAELAALPSTPQVDPAEVERLQQEVATQRQLVSQLEQLEQQFGAAMPPALRQGLDEARQQLQAAEAQLQSMGIAAQPLPPVSEEAQPRADEQVAQPAATSIAQPEPAMMPQAAPASSQPPEAPAPPQQVEAVAAAAPPTPQPSLPAQAQPSGPRFVLRDGTTIAIPAGSEIVIGREDPISGIHPDVDLTSYGGEAGGVSRRHAVLREQGGQWTITDLDSTNYTHVDGQRIAPNTPTPLQDGARVRFGRVELNFHTS